MDLQISFDAMDCDVQDMGDTLILTFSQVFFEANIMFDQREWLAEVCNEMVKALGPKMALADNYEPIELDVTYIRGVTISYDGVQVFAPSEDEPYWELVFDDEDSDSHVSVRFKNEIARKLIAELNAAKTHQYEWIRTRVYIGVDHQPMLEEIEKCRGIAADPEATPEKKRAMLEMLGCQVVIGEGEKLPKGTLLSDSYLCNCGARQKD